jgi:hypothetical protein
MCHFLGSILKRLSNKAVERYQLEAAELLGQIRAEISMGRRLVSASMYQSMHGLYYDTLLQVDASLEYLIGVGPKATDKDWRAQHTKSFDLAQTAIENVLIDLAHELQLTAPVATGGGR